MAKIANATFNGNRGSYSFEVYPIDTVFNPVGAVYVFTRRSLDASGKGSHDLLYIGETGSLADRIPNHEKWAGLIKHRANCICVHRDGNSISRLSKETDLRAANDAPLNVQ